MDTILLEFAKEGILAPVLVWFMFQQRRMTTDFQSAIVKAVGKTVLTSEQSVEISSAMVKAASIDKIDFIRRRLEKNNLDKYPEEIKKHIRTELTRQSSFYIKSLNQYNAVGKIMLGDWVAENFPMDDFLNEVYDCVFRQDISLHRKLMNIETIMMSYQNQMWEELRIYLNKR